MRWLALASVAACTFVAGCGGDEQAVSTQAGTTTLSPLNGIDDLATEANRTEELLESRVEALLQADSLAELGPELRAVESELRYGTARLQRLSLSSELDAARDGLARALRTLADAVAEVQADVESLDLGAALDDLGGLDLGDASAAIEEIRRLAGE
jgi:hypothetical protein